MKLNEQGDMLLRDEFNGRVSTLNDFIINDSYDRFCNDDDEYIVDKCSVRQNQDKILTARGKHIIDLCIQSRLRLLNKGNNKITELRTILQRESQNS